MNRKSKFSWFEVLILKWTQRLWNKYISMVLCRAHSAGVLSSSRLHILASRFDPTQYPIELHKVPFRGIYTSDMGFGIERDFRNSCEYAGLTVRK